MRTLSGPGQAPGLTFAQDVDGVALAEVQVLGALSCVVIERQHLVLDGPLLQGVFSLEGGQSSQSSAGVQKDTISSTLTWHHSLARPASATSCTLTSDPSAPPTGVST